MLVKKEIVTLIWQALVLLVSMCLAFLTMIISLLILAPIWVSSESFNALISREASIRLQREVQIDRIEWGLWDGLLIKGVRIADDPNFSYRPMIFLHRAGLTIGKTSSRLGLNIELMVDGVVLRIIRNAEGISNLEQWLLKDKPSTPPKSDEPFNINNIRFKAPFDVEAVISFHQISCLVQDVITGKTALIDDAAFNVKIPSLLNERITANLSSGMMIADHDRRLNLPPAFADLNISRLFNTTGELELDNAGARLHINLTGFESILDLSFMDETIQAIIQADLSQLYLALSPLGIIPPELAEADLSGKFDLRAAVRGFKDETGTLNPAKSWMVIHSRFPGVSLQVEADMRHLEVNSDIHIDLSSLMHFIRPLLPQDLEHVKLGGEVQLRAVSSLTPESKAVYDVGLTVRQLHCSGGPLQDKALGPLSLRLYQQGEVDWEADHITIRQGGLELFDEPSIKWSGTAAKLQSPAPDVRLRISPINLNLDRLIQLLLPVLPDNIVLSTSDNSRLNIEHILISGKFPAERAALEIQGLDFQFNGIRLEHDEFPLVISDIRLSPLDLSMTIVDMLPQQIFMKAGININKIEIQGAQPAVIAGFRLNHIGLKADSIKLDPSAQFGLTGLVELEESISIDSISLPDFVTLKELEQSLLLNTVLSVAEPAVKLRSFQVNLPDIRLNHPELGWLNTKAAIKVQADHAGVPSADSFVPDINNAMIQVWADDVLNLILHLNSAQAGSKISMQGQLAADLSRLHTSAAATLLAGYKVIPAEVSGIIQAGWKLAGKLPLDTDIKTWDHSNLISDPTPLLQYIEGFEVSVDLKNTGLNLHLDQDQRVIIKQINTPKPFSYHLAGKTGNGKLGLELDIQGIEVLLDQTFEPPLALKLGISGKHELLNNIRLVQHLEVQPFHFSERAEIFIQGLDKLLKATLEPNLNHIMNKLDITGNADIQADYTAGLSSFLPGISLDGAVNAGAEFSLKPADSMGIKIRLGFDDLSLNIEDEITVEKLNADFKLNKNFQLALSGDDLRTTAIIKDKPLSAEVLRPYKTTRIQDDAEIRDDFYLHKLQSRLNVSHSIFFNSAFIKGETLPLTLGPSALDLQFEQGLPRINHLQVNILGGDIDGSLLIIQPSERFHLKADLIFSGLDMRRLFPQSLNHAALDHDREISGSIRLDLPLISELKPLIRELELDLQLNHIGAKSLEWLLYSLDPMENDENIVAQRKLIRHGTPKWVRIRIRDGAFSLNGELTVKGVSMRIPPIDRLNIGSLQGIHQYEIHLAALEPLISILQQSSAKAILITEDGTLKFK